MKVLIIGGKGQLGTTLAQTAKENMLEHIKVEIKPEMIIAAVNKMTKKERESFLEDLLASTAPDYLASIKEARSDYKAGRVKAHHEVFGYRKL